MNELPQVIVSLLESMWRDVYAKCRAIAQAEIVSFFGGSWRGGKLDGSAIGGPIATSALPLTSEGDILIYKGGQLQRLGIGTEGQLLTVVSGYPAWVTGTSTPTSSNTFVDDNGTPADITDNAGSPATLSSD